MKTVYLVRHGQTDSNAAFLTGSSVDPLSVQGKRQAELVGARFKDIPIDVLIASPYTRARHTADAIAAHKPLKVIESDLFVEIISPPEVEGFHHADPSVQHIRDKRQEYWGVPGAHYSSEENFYDAVERADAALAFLTSRPEKEIVVASHGGFMRMLAQRIIIGDFLTPDISSHLNSHTAMSNTGVTVITLTEGLWRLVRWNDTVHLDPINAND